MWEHCPIITLLCNDFLSASALTCRSSEEIKNTGGILAEEVWYAAFGAKEVENIQLLMAPDWRVWQDFLLAAANCWGVGETRAVPLYWHHTKRSGLDKWCAWFGQIQATDWAKPVPSNRLQTADLRQRRPQRNRGLRPMTSVLCLRMPTITGTCRGILVIASSLGGQYLSLNPAKKYLIFRIWSAGLKEIVASCVWREVGPWLKPEKPAALGAWKSRFLKAISSGDFRVTYYIRGGPEDPS